MSCMFGLQVCERYTHLEWLGTTTTNRHGVVAFDFATVPGVISYLSVQPVHVVEYLTF